MLAGRKNAVSVLGVGCSVLIFDVKETVKKLFLGHSLSLQIVTVETRPGFVHPLFSDFTAPEIPCQAILVHDNEVVL